MLVGNNHGVGLSGMRERVRELGGTLEIQIRVGTARLSQPSLPVANMAVVGA